ncbi:MAG: hypothetical protein ACFFBP_14590 [Promethearchaeota archaeon]
MAEYLSKYDFKNPPSKIEYLDDDPFKLSQELIFYHNKNTFRKELTKLQNIFKSYTKNPLIASGIRDSYLEEEYFENYLIILFTKGDLVEKTNDIIKQRVGKTIEPGCYYIIITSEYMLLLSKDMKGLISGINIMEEIFIQTFEDYFKRNNLNKFIQIRSFTLYGS